MHFKIIFSLILAVAMIACGGSGGSDLYVTFNGTAVPLDVKSTGVYPSTKTFSSTADGQTVSTKAVNHYIALASFEMDTKGPVTMGAPLSADGQVRVVLQIVGAEGTDEKALPKTGNFPAKCEKYDCVDFMSISRFTGGKEEKFSFTRAAEGMVKITAVSDDTVIGEIDVREGQNAVKGGFTAKITTKR